MCPGHDIETSHTAVERRVLERAVHDHATVLEVGCGRTTRLIDLRERIDRLVGLDTDAEAGHENPYLDEFVEADAHRLPFEDGSFDLVYANFVVEHLAEPVRAFGEWRRVLHVNGELVLLTTNIANPLLGAARHLPQSVRVLTKKRVTGAAERDVFPTVYRANTTDRLRTALEVAGFEQRELTTVATLYRYAGAHRHVAAALARAERALPSRRLATIVGEFQAV